MNKIDIEKAVNSNIKVGTPILALFNGGSSHYKGSTIYRSVIELFERSLKKLEEENKIKINYE